MGFQLQLEAYGANLKPVCRKIPFYFFLITILVPCLGFGRAHKFCKDVVEPAGYRIRQAVRKGEIELTTPLFRQYAQKRGYERTSFTPQYGYLKGFEIQLRLFFLGKIELKHKVTRTEVMQAFNRWHEGPVFSYDNNDTTRWSGNERYWFVAKMPPKKQRKLRQRSRPQNQYMKVIFDVTQEHEIRVVTAFYVKYNHYVDFMGSPKEVD